MALPRVGLIESALLIIAVVILAAISSKTLLLLILMYLINGIFLTIAIRESAHWFLKKEKYKRDLCKFGQALIIGGPIGVILMIAVELNLVNFLVFTTLIGMFIHGSYELKKNAWRPYLIGAGIMIAQYLFFALLALILGLFGILF